MAWWAFARSHAMPEEDCIELAAEVADGFVETPFARSPTSVATRSMLDLWVKDETGNVAGSHKARHLIGIMLHLRGGRAARPAAGPPAAGDRLVRQRRHRRGHARPTQRLAARRVRARRG